MRMSEEKIALFSFQRNPWKVFKDDDVSEGFHSFLRYFGKNGERKSKKVGRME